MRTLRCWVPLLLLATSGAVAAQTAFRTLAWGTSSGIHDAAQVVVRKQAGWTDLWARHTSNQQPAPPLPDVDFTREMVIAVFLGDKPTGGYGVEITRVDESRKAVFVYVHQTSPAPGDTVIQTITQPHHIIAVARSS